jgi:hypothetical protein
VKRRVWFIVGGVALVVLLAGGAYMGGRLLAQQPQAAGSDGGMGLSIAGGSGGPRSFKMSKEPAPELPQTPADAQGIFVRSEDRSIFIGTGQVTMMAKASPGQAPQTSSDYDGPVVEVVINQDTTIYRDTTKLPETAPSGDIEVQQTVGPGSIDEIGENSMLQVWGNKTGDRVVAQVVVYSQPTILNAKPAGK